MGGLTLIASAAVAAAVTIPPETVSIDGRVVRVELPPADVSLSYVETKGGMAIKLAAGAASVQGSKFFVGDGVVAVPLEVVPGRGIVLQGKTVLLHGHEFKRDSTVTVLPGFRKASDLRPGDVYVTLPGLVFDGSAK